MEFFTNDNGNHIPFIVLKRQAKIKELKEERDLLEKKSAKELQDGDKELAYQYDEDINSINRQIELIRSGKRDDLVEDVKIKYKVSKPKNQKTITKLKDEIYELTKQKEAEKHRVNKIIASKPPNKRGIVGDDAWKHYNELKSKIKELETQLKELEDKDKPKK